MVLSLNTVGCYKGAACNFWARAISVAEQALASTGAHSANFNEKVHKPKSKSYSRIGTNM